MSFNFDAFKQKMEQLIAVLPSIGQLVQVAETIAPHASGLTKAGFVINTVIAAEPALVGTEQMLHAAVTNVVTTYRAAGTLPVSGTTSTATAPAPGTPLPVPAGVGSAAQVATSA